MRLIDADLYCATICKCNRRACDRVKCPIHNAPTAYDIDKVVEELGDRVNEANNNCLCEMHENGHTLDFENENGRIKGLKEAIEIVKQGDAGTGTEAEKIRDKAVKWNNHSTKKVPYEFIEFVEGKRTINADDDVCEWRIVDRPNNLPIYNTSCGKIRLQYVTGVDIYCNGCGKKIKVVE